MGGASDQTKNQQNLTAEQTQSQIDFTKTLQSMFQTQYGNQQNILNFLKDTLTPVIQRAEAGNGLSPEALTAMRTGATEQTASQFNNAQTATQELEAMHGGNGLPSGVNAQLTAANATAAANSGANAQRQITEYNSNIAQSNLWNGVNALNGLAAQENPLGYAASANSGSEGVASLSGAQSSLQNSITNANANSFGGQFMSSVGKGLAGGLTGTLGEGLPFANGF